MIAREDIYLQINRYIELMRMCMNPGKRTLYGLRLRHWPSFLSISIYYILRVSSRGYLGGSSCRITRPRHWRKTRASSTFCGPFRWRCGSVLVAGSNSRDSLGPSANRMRNAGPAA